ncbi:MAG: nuclear transport factor 2 family protein [Variovorax sp.]|nr:MAG: nuclear transport factor 2 family protein [Variovorax sp.]
MNTTSHALECEQLRTTERARLQALVQKDIAPARTLHADDFQLITPVGMPLSKAQYLGAIEAGQLAYIAWEPKTIEVRLYGETAALRYLSSLEVRFGAHHVPRADHWHTDLYEKRDGAWQVVWSQATQVQPGLAA